MNEQLQRALAGILSRATQGIDVGTQFLSAQLPDVIQQLLMWKLAISGLSTLLSIAIAVAVAYGYYRLLKWDLRRADHIDRGFPSVIGGMGAVIALLLTIYLFSMDWLQILIAPKIYLIEYAASLAK